ncbi:MAG TPA: mechanosensitive ion channel domain-containing protein [Candidatus Polarisedimenticolaceae bacterium]|nr:mechanosensitive ion channel domain-containing protein [Candidatus Polarisedimenticolaceae bacterium]
MRRPWKSFGILLVVLLATGGADAQEQETSRAAATAPVILDGEELFRVRGVSAFPAEERASAIARAIRDAAKDRAVDPGTVRTETIEFGTRIMAGPRRIMAVLEADAQPEGIHANELAAIYARRIARALTEYRQARTPQAIKDAWVAALVGMVALAIGLALVFWIWRRLHGILEHRLRQRVQSLETKSFRLVDAQRIWSGLRGLVNLARILAILALVYVFLHVVLARFPNTRGVAVRLGDYAIGPLRTMGSAFLGYIPNLIFLVILFVVVRALLRLTRLFFESIEHSTITFDTFEPEWAAPTYRLVRLVILAFAAVVAYPFLPGSGTAAFQGVSLFLGLVLSLGSGSAVSNIIAGYALTYRRAFRVGDVIRIGDKVGRVLATRLQVTHLRTPKNEELIVPNATILNSEVVNYSTRTRGEHEGLVLHTTVGIGYDTPWRQVEAMLLLAAGRTEGVIQEPPPFVNQLSLGDFAVTYELNAYTRTPERMPQLYTALHRHILDVFNEHGVAIMTPAYEGDPEQPKVVPREQWYAPPARPEKAV